MHELFHLIFSKDFWGGNYYYPHFIDRESEAIGPRYQREGFKAIHEPGSKGREYGDDWAWQIRVFDIKQLWKLE